MHNKTKLFDCVTGRAVFFLIAAGFLILLTATRSSILYPYNNWDDANSYLSMGKSMFQGRVIYRDIFDQKGPYLYLFYGLASLVSRTDFRGVFLLEWLFAVADLLLIYRILVLLAPKGDVSDPGRTARRQMVSLLLAPFLLALCFTSRSFYWGGSAEELCLPFMLVTLFVLLNHESSMAAEPYSWKEIITAGVCSGVVACIKFTILGFFFAFMVMVLFHSGSISRFFKSCAVFLLAMAAPILPWIVYFGALHSLADFYRVYIYTNVFLYSSFGANSKGEGIYDKVYSLSKLLYWLIITNARYFILIISGCIYFLFRKGSGIRERLCPSILFFFTFLGIFIGGSDLPYYSLPLTVFAVTGGVLLCDALCFAAGKGNPGSAAKTAAVLLPALAVYGLLTFVLTPNRYYLSYEKEDVFLSHFAEDIRSSGIETPTLLNVGCLDCGLYTTADILPTCYWFQTQTLPTDEVENNQFWYMENGDTDFVVTRNTTPEILDNHYEQIDSFHQVMGGQEFDYYLYQKVR